jgi:molybdopterin converting factor small subunit
MTTAAAATAAAAAAGTATAGTTAAAAGTLQRLLTKLYNNSNGTYVNGAVIGKNKVFARPLQEGDLIDLFVPKSKNAKEQQLTYTFHAR